MVNQAMAAEFEKPVHLLRYRAAQFVEQANQWLLLYGDDNMTVEDVRLMSLRALVAKRTEDRSNVL